MSKLAWRNLVRMTASVFFAAGVAAPAMAQGVSEDSAEAADASGPIQIAQGRTTYEVPARTEDRPRRGETVAGRARPQYDALGARVGSFVFLPKLELQERYETNIFATPNNEEDDFITRILPRVRVASDWNNHQLQFDAGAAVGIHAQNPDEDYEDYFVGTSGRVDVRRSTNVRLGVRYDHGHDDRSNPDDAGTGEEPTEFDEYTANTALFHNFGRLNATLDGSFGRITFDDVDTVGGGTNINHDRDRNVYEGGLRIGYEIVPEYEAFVRGSYNVRQYDGTDFGTGIDRDSNGYGVVVGMEVDFGGLIFGDFFAGFRHQDYDDPTLDSLNGVGAGADITWNVTGLTTITGSLLSDVRETTQAGASGRLVSTGQIGIDHELLRNLILGADVGATRDDYEGINRTDWLYRAGIDATYLINRYLRVGADYDFVTRDADNANNDYTNHVFLVRVGLQY
ncbi:MAG TPA: outer membrane beta-barrel protein [Kiloniellales bacterium]